MRRLYSLWIDILWLIAFALATMIFALDARASGGDYVVEKRVVPSRTDYILHADKKTWHYVTYGERYVVLLRAQDSDEQDWDTLDEIVVMKEVSLEVYLRVDSGNYFYFEN